LTPHIYFDVINQSNATNSNQINLGSQDIANYSDKKAQYTAQISGSMLNSIGCKYAMIGHSETRRDHQLDISNIKSKIIEAVQNNLIPVYCIGFTDETLAHTQLSLELDNLLENCDSNQEIFDALKNSPSIIAFEPIANIGSGSALTKEKISHYLGFIKSILVDKGLGNVKLLYGGSVSSSNIVDLSECDNLDGFLLGGASLKSNELEKIFSLNI
jgi:triosephosphate isomerase